MNKYLAYIGTIITLLTLIIGGVTSYNKLEAKTEKSQEKLAKVEDKVEDLEKENNEIEKNLTEFSVEQRYIRKSVDDTSVTLKELLKELKK